MKDFGIASKLNGTEKLIFSKFYEDHYLTIVDDASIIVYKKGEPEPVLSASLSFVPTTTKAGHDGEFIVFSTGSQIATLDMETMSIKEWSVDGDTYDWLDNDMIYSVKEGELFVYDFDGLNRRKLSSNVSARFPVTITHDKWLYYFSDDTLTREIVSN